MSRKLHIGDHVELRGRLSGHSGTITRLGMFEVTIKLDPGQIAQLGRTVINVSRRQIARHEGTRDE